MKERVLPPAIRLNRAVGRAQFLRVLVGRPEALAEWTSWLGRDLSQMIFEIFQQRLGLIGWEIGQRRPNRSRVGGDVARLVVTYHDRCSSHSGDG